MTSKISIVLGVLGDGKWHNLGDIRQQTYLASEEMMEIADFLAKYGFAEVDNSNQRVKINPAFKRILTQNVT